ncbi:ribosomal-protein-alanine N-acetyltransferase [bacterium]|nr:MAG: ribosomal-protein-alanine N-acetyltransferase [bacterium]
MAAVTRRFERLAEHHIEAVVAIEKVSNGSPWSDRGFRNEIDNPHAIFLVALEAGEVVGYGGVWLVIDEAHIVNVAVRADRRRQGIAREIVRRLLDDSKAAGMKTASLEVRAGNEGAIRLYEEFGFVTTNTRKRYYPDNREDAFVMWRFAL